LLGDAIAVVSPAAYVSAVIASHPVGAKRRRMTGSTKQSISPLKEEWIASSLRSSQ
jgi:hypothetical protein